MLLVLLLLALLVLLLLLLGLLLVFLLLPSPAAADGFLQISNTWDWNVCASFDDGKVTYIRIDAPAVRIRNPTTVAPQMLFTQGSLLLLFLTRLRRRQELARVGQVPAAADHRPQYDRCSCC